MKSQKSRLMTLVSLSLISSFFILEDVSALVGHGAAVSAAIRHSRHRPHPTTYQRNDDSCCSCCESSCSNSRMEIGDLAVREEALAYLNGEDETYQLNCDIEQAANNLGIDLSLGLSDESKREIVKELLQNPSLAYKKN